MDIRGGGHQTFTDFSGVLETMDGLIEPETGFTIVNGFAAAWALHHAGHVDATPLFDGRLSIDAAATLMQ